MKRLLLLLSFSFLSLSMMAERIECSMALNIAKTILPESQLTNLSSKANYNNMYIFSGENSFVIIAADDRATPVLGYSQEYPFVIENLPKREREIIDMRFGLGEKEELTQKEVADIMGISQSYISRLEKRIIKKLGNRLNAQFK